MRELFKNLISELYCQSHSKAPVQSLAWVPNSGVPTHVVYTSSIKGPLETTLKTSRPPGSCDPEAPSRLYPLPGFQSSLSSGLS